MIVRACARIGPLCVLVAVLLAAPDDAAAQAGGPPNGPGAPRGGGPELRITPLLPPDVSMRSGRVAIRAIETGSGELLRLDSIELPTGWAREGAGADVALVGVPNAGAATPLTVPLRGGWAKVRFARTEDGASVLAEAGDDARVLDTARSNADAQVELTVELGAGTPNHAWRDPGDVPSERALAVEPGVLKEPSAAPRRLAFEERYGLSPHPFLPARTVVLPARIDFPRAPLLERGRVKIMLAGTAPTRATDVEVTVEAIPVSGTGPVSGRAAVRVGGSEAEPVTAEIPLPDLREGPGRLVVTLRPAFAQPGATNDARAASPPQGMPGVRVVQPEIAGFATVKTRPPNVVVITLDTTRADHLSLFGYERDTSPFLSGIASDLIVYDRAYSQIQNTRPSHFSIFTSRYANDLGIWNNDGPSLPERELTLAEVLRSAGWSTAATISVPFMGPKSGIAQGFDRFQIPVLREYSQVGAETTRRAEALVSDLADRPFFLWVHYFDAHLPYQPVPSYRGLFWPGPPPTEVDVDRSLLFDGAEKEFFVVPNRAYMTAMYDASIRYLDAQLRQLFAHLERLGLLDRTIVVVTADHGESLGDHGLYFVHDGLFEPTVRVPLLLRLPRGVAPAGRVGTVVENLGIAPTVLDALGLVVPPSFRGRSLLRPAPPSSGTAFFEHHGRLATGFRAGNVKFIDARALKQQPEMAHGNLRRWYEAPAISLFDLATDPDELHDLAPSDPARAAEATRRLEAWLAEGGGGAELPRPAATIDPELERSLKSLGYLR